MPPRKKVETPVLEKDPRKRKAAKSSGPSGMGNPGQGCGGRVGRFWCPIARDAGIEEAQSQWGMAPLSEISGGNFGKLQERRHEMMIPDEIRQKSKSTSILLQIPWTIGTIRTS